jgi:3-hydroxyisobutyrate dehydrogenase-like beta-hydroxyacid dehydrogenase
MCVSALCVIMARRLADCGFHVTAVYDVNRAAATKLAGELGCAACQDLSEVTAQSDRHHYGGER